jgi:type I site-specific restriction-modification system R (restriction) subunit
LRDAIRRLNPAIPGEAQEEALRKVLRVATPSLTQTNRAFHRMLRDGVPVEYPRPDGSIAGDHVRLASPATWCTSLRRCRKVPSTFMPSSVTTTASTSGRPKTY